MNFDRLRWNRLARVRTELEPSELGGVLCFDMYNIPYITNTTHQDPR
ncbi:MAG: hypothetical protein ACE5JN_00225 [Candidatus Methylomirabilia bacterium]